MGLDMFAHAVKESVLSSAVKDLETDVVLDDVLGESNREEIHYWRKHHDLHGWMHNLYIEKGGKDEQFNCNTLRLTLEDLDVLENDIRSHNLPETTGFFFGNNPPDEEAILGDLEFIDKARNYINDGYAVFYSSWW